MKIVVADWETFFDRKGGYTLDRMSTESYIRDPRFQAHGCAIKWSPNEAAIWYDGNEVRAVMDATDWRDVFLIHHHAHFDAMIENHHYGVRPGGLGCTLSMARLVLGNHLSVSLDSVRRHFGMPVKRTPYHLFDGKRWEDLTPAVRQQIGVGACDEVESIWQIFQLLNKQTPPEELKIIDTVIRMFTEPVLTGDVSLLAQIWEDEARRKRTSLAELGVTESDLQSADRFAELLRECDIEPETKEGKKGAIYAFAKTDNFMRDLLEHEDDRVRLLAETRLGVKSTLMQTRAATLGFMANRGPLSVYLSMYGADTLRVSGGDGANWLNFKRGSPLRRAICAPKGFLLAPVDASQIECRVLHYLAGGADEPVVQKFRNHEDPYVDVASRFYGVQVYKPKQDDPRRSEMEAMRGMGKQGRLMCGYGCAGKKFKQTAKNGLYGPPVEISIEEATRFVKMYRDDNPSVCARNVGYWAQCSRMLARLAGGDPVDWGPLHVRDHRIYLPNGLFMRYDTLEYYVPGENERHLYKETEQNGFWRVRTRNGWKTMWGSKLTQNICEFVSRVIVSQAMIRITGMGYRVLNWPYDELLCLIPNDGHGAEHAERVRQELAKPVAWLPGLPLDAEVTVGERYLK